MESILLIFALLFSVLSFMAVYRVLEEGASNRHFVVTLCFLFVTCILWGVFYKIKSDKPHKVIIVNIQSNL